MRRFGFAGSLVVMTCLVAGCGDKKPKAEPIQSAQTDTGSLQPDLYATDGGAKSPYSSPTTPAAYDYSSTPTTTSGAMTGGQSHTVAKGDTLYSLARKYYGNQSKWKDIYEANKASIPNPNTLKVGQKLIIP